MKKYLLLFAALAFLGAGCKKFNTNEHYVPAEGISLDQDHLTILVGEDARLIATVSPTNTTNKTVLWKSSNESAATVEDGVVKGLRRGGTRITASTVSPSISVDCEVDVVTEKIPLTSIAVTPAVSAIRSGQKVQLYVSRTPSNSTSHHFIWTSSNDRIAVVDANGLVTGFANGEVTITAISKDDEGIEAQATVRVVTPCEEIQITQPDPTPMDLGPDETIKIKYKLIPEDSRDLVTFKVEQGDRSVIEVASDGTVKGKAYSSQVCKIRVSSQADPSIYTDVEFKTYDYPNGIEMFHKGYSERLTQYVGAGRNQTFTLRIQNKSQVKPGTKIVMVGPDNFNLHAQLNSEGTEMTVGASQYASTSTSSSYVNVNVTVHAGGKEFKLPFKISKYDPFYPKPGDLIYYGTSNYKLQTADGGFRGDGIFENPATTMPNYANLKLGIIAHLGSEALSEDPFAASLNMPGLDGSGLHGIAIPFNTDFVCRKEDPYAFSGSDYSNSCWRTIPDPSEGDEMFCQDRRSIAGHESPNISNFDVSRLVYGSASSQKRLAFHNTVGLLYYNLASGDSYRIHQILYVTSPEAHAKYHGGANNIRYTVSSHFYYGHSASNSNINYSAPLGTAPGNKRTTPWCLPTSTDLLTIFAETSSISGVQSKVVKEKFDVFYRSVRLFSGNNKAYYANNVYWTSQEVDANSAVSFSATDQGAVTIAYEDKRVWHKCLPVFYF